MKRRIICRTIFGSKLYGTDTKESDTDYKSVFMPTPLEILTGKIPKSITMSTGKNDSRNVAEDVDHESFSLQYFMELLYQGQTVALDMLHGDKEDITTPTWEELKSNRKSFYTKNMRSFVGYARKQAAKYGVKGSRLDAAREALAFLITKGDRTIGDLWVDDELWTGEHTHLHTDWVPEETPPNASTSYWEVCGKKMTFGGKASHYVPMLKKFYENYGGRAQLAAENKGVDWKALSHALRVAYQTRAILEGRSYQYPLLENSFLKAVKAGVYDYNTVVAPALDNAMGYVEDMAKESTLPERVDTGHWNMWLSQQTWKYLFDAYNSELATDHG